MLELVMFVGTIVAAACAGLLVGVHYERARRADEDEDAKLLRRARPEPGVIVLEDYRRARRGGDAA